MNPHYEKYDYKIFNFLLNSEDLNLQIQPAINFSIPGDSRCQEVKCKVCKGSNINNLESK
jgi:hypothetical protein